MKKLLLLFLLAFSYATTDISAQGWFGKMVDGFRKRVQQLTYNRPRVFQPFQNDYQQQNNNIASDESSDTASDESSDTASDENIPLQSSEKTVTLVTSGTGITKEEATRNALRSAIEQAYGTFVSANTKVLNDELIKDEVTTVSAGTIKSYKELSLFINDNGLYDVSVQATVSIDQLTEFAQSKGMQAELAGATFVMNMRMRELNKKNELTAINHMFEKAKAIAKNGLFDYKLEIGDPQLASNGKYEIKTKLLMCENDNTRSFYNYVFQTLAALSLSSTERKEYDKIGLKYYRYTKALDEIESDARNDDTFILRNKLPVSNTGSNGDISSGLTPMVIESALNYLIQDNLGNKIYCTKVHLESASNQKSVDDLVDDLKWYLKDWKHRYAWCYFKNNKIIVWEVVPKNRIYINGGITNGITHYTDRGTRAFNPSFYPSIRDKQKNNIFFFQEFYLLYSEEELSRLNNITIERRMD